MKTMKKIISILTAIMLVVTIIPMSAFAADTPSYKFEDVTPGSWCSDAIDYMYKNGYMTGFDAKHFGPNQTTTRAQFVTVLGRIEGIDTNKYNSMASKFVDTPKDWAYAYITWAAENGIVNGFDAKHFGPNGYITRAQAATILYRYVSQKYGDKVQFEKGASNGRPDSNTIGAWAKDGMDWAMSNSLITGYGVNGPVKPDNSATRAELATILYRFCMYVEKLENGTTEPSTSPEPTPTPDPCENGHTWVDYIEDIDLSGLDVAVELTEREWVFAKSARVMKCPCGLNTNQWHYDHYLEYDNANALTIGRSDDGDRIECPWDHNPTVTANMDTVFPQLYTKHYTASDTSKTIKVITGQKCSVCGEIAKDDAWKNPNNWILHTKTVIEKEAYDETVGGIDQYYCSNLPSKCSQRNVPVYPPMDEDGNILPNWDGTCTECGKNLKHKAMPAYTYHHDNYVNDNIYDYYELVIDDKTVMVNGQPIQIKLDTCSHDNMMRDWGDGSGYVGMKCMDCGQSFGVVASELYK